MSIGLAGDRSSTLEDLSALADGELDLDATARVCRAWRDDAGLRSNWHAYQLIGDVLRSEDLASAPARDALFLERVRQRLALEPAVLAPARQQASAARSRSRWSWMAPSAVAAGFVLVASVVVMTQVPLPGGASGDKLADAAPAQPVVVGAPAALVAPEASSAAWPAPGNAKLVRDPRLDRYLAAHQQFAGSGLGVPAGFLRNAVAEVPSR